MSFPPGDVGALARAVGRVLDDPVDAARRARRARTSLGVEFDWRRIAAATARVYAQARAGGPAELGRPKIPTGNAFAGGRG